MGDLNGSFAPKHELILFACKGRHVLHFPDKRLADIWKCSVKYSGSFRLHPNEKPLSWVENIIACSSVIGDVVLDLFCGSGSFLEASKRLERRFIGVEIDQHYHKLSVDRLS